MSDRLPRALLHLEGVVLAAAAIALYFHFDDPEVAVEVGLIWTAHIGIDRAIGYGLKYRSGFKDTHLQRV